MSLLVVIPQLINIPLHLFHVVEYLWLNLHELELARPARKGICRAPRFYVVVVAGPRTKPIIVCLEQVSIGDRAGVVDSRRRLRVVVVVPRRGRSRFPRAVVSGMTSSFSPTTAAPAPAPTPPAPPPCW